MVVGTASRAGFAHLTSGSVSEGVVRRSEVPVLVARVNHEPLGHYRKVLVPTDFSDAARRALDLAVTLADKGAKISLLHAIDTDLAGHALADELEGHAAECASRMIAEYGNAGFQFDFTVARDGAKHAILERSKGVDLVVMGTHGRRGFTRLFLGSLASHMVRHASCSVATVHAP